MTLQYIYDRLQPFKLDSTDRHGICGDYGCVTSDVITDAGLDIEDLEKLPRGVFLGKEYTLDKNKGLQEYYVFSKHSLAGILNIELQNITFHEEVRRSK